MVKGNAARGEDETETIKAGRRALTIGLSLLQANVSRSINSFDSLKSEARGLGAVGKDGGERALRYLRRGK